MIMHQNSFKMMITALNIGVKEQRPYIYCPITTQNIMFARLLLEGGFIIGYFRMLTSENELCIWIKYTSNKPSFKKIKLLDFYIPDIFVSSKKKCKGGGKAYGLYVFSSNAGGLYFFDRIVLFTKKPFGGTIIAKIEI